MVSLAHCDVVMLFGDINLSTAVNIDLWPVWYSPETSFKEVLKISIRKMSLKNALVKLLTYLSGANELMLDQG